MKYYVAKGQNGVIISDTYGRSLYCRKYLTHPTIKAYKDYTEAEHAALDHLASIVPYYVPLPDHLSLNDIVTRKRLIRESECKKE